MLYLAGFNAADLGLGSMIWRRSGKPDITVDLAALAGADQDSVGSSYFWHYVIGSTFHIQGEDPAATTRLRKYSAKSFGRIAFEQVAFGALFGGWASTGTLDVAFSLTTGKYTFSYGLAFTVEWTTDAGRAMFGFTADLAVAATSFTSDAVPTYAIVPTLAQTSRFSPNYEPENIANHAIADDGAGYGINRTVAPIYRDWTQEFEPKAKTERLAAASTHPWTFRHLFEHCRGQFPFIVSGGFGESYDEAFFDRTEGTRWNARRGGPDQLVDSVWHIPFQTVVEGKVVSP